MSRLVRSTRAAPELTRTAASCLLALPILTLFGLGWWAFIEHISNNEKLSSSVFRQVMFVLRTSDKIESLLGEGVHLEPTWWTGGESYIAGTIHVLKGKADLG